MSKEAELEARVAALEAKLAEAQQLIGLVKGDLRAHQVAAGGYWNLLRIAGDDLNSLEGRVRQHKEEFAKVWTHLAPVLEQLFPGISDDLLKISRFGHKDEPTEISPPIGKKD